MEGLLLEAQLADEAQDENTGSPRFSTGSDVGDFAQPRKLFACDHRGFDREFERKTR